MSTAKIRAIKLQKLRESYADDAPTKPAWAALQQLEAATTDLEQRRTSLAESGHFTAAGVYEQLREHRVRHAKALRDAQAALKSSAEKLLGASQGIIELPADHQRILTHWQSLPPSERQSALIRAMSGKDPELCATIAHGSNERYVGLTAASLQVLRSRFANAEATEANVPRLAAHQICNDLITETLATLEQ